VTHTKRDTAGKFAEPSAGGQRPRPRRPVELPCRSNR